MIITIDGPTASGKSTLAKKISNQLKIYYLNSGYLYRGLAYVLAHFFNYDENKLKNILSEELDSIFQDFKYEYDGQNEKILFKDKEITSNLKTSEIDNYSSIISRDPKVRKLLHSYQQQLAKNYDLVAEGRDCGSVVFPNADLKIFLVAAIETRAKRWQKDMEKKGKLFSLEESMKIVSERDERDEKRKISPLIIPKDALVIDDSDLNKDELLEKVLKLIKNLKINS